MKSFKKNLDELIEDRSRLDKRMMNMGKKICNWCPWRRRNKAKA